MEWKRKYLLLLFLMLTSVTISLSQFRWDTLRLENEISPNYTRGICFDHQHYMWLNTSRGLYRIDGHEARYYVHNPEDTLSLLNNIVTKVYEDDDKDLWILTDKGVQMYEHKTEVFRSILQDYVASYKDSLFKYGFECAMQVDAKHILFGTKDGCVLYDKFSRAYKYIPILSQTTSMGYSSLAHVVEIIADPRDSTQFYMLTKSGIYAFSSSTLEISFVSKSPKVDFASISSPGLSMVVHGDYLYFIVRKEVYSYEISTDTYRHVGFSNFKDRDFVIRDILISQQGSLIVSTTGNGVYEANLLPPHSPTQLIPGLYNQMGIDPDGHLVTIANTSSVVLSQGLYGKPRQDLPYLTLEKIWVNDNRKLLRDVFASDVYRLRDFERNIDLQVSLNKFSDNAEVVYSYKLDDDEWKEMGTDRRLSLRDVAVGDHTIQFKASHRQHVILSESFSFHIDRFFYEQWWFRILVLSTIVFFLVAIYYLLRSLKRNREYYNRQVIEMELNALRSQMNPHFLFNTLNSIKNYVLTKSPDEAAYYLTKFSQLIRSILENSKVPLLTLQQELDSIKLYVEMEHLRFGGEFEYNIHVDEDIDVLQFKIAPMLIQPFIENAIWHGLMNIKSDRKLSISFVSNREGVLCTVEDNGIGLTKSKELQSKRNQHKKSLGLDITLQRIKNINILYNIDAHVDIADRHPKGTIVTVYLPSLDM